MREADVGEWPARSRRLCAGWEMGADDDDGSVETGVCGRDIAVEGEVEMSRSKSNSDEG
jgi:hypothetical protein